MNKIEVVRGTTCSFAIALVDEEKNPYNLADGEVLRFGIKKRPEHDECIFEKEITKSTDGVCTVQIERTDTENLPFGKYFFDVGLQSGNMYYPVIEIGEFRIMPNITRWGGNV
jgi:hypothetical protein